MPLGKGLLSGLAVVLLLAACGPQSAASEGAEELQVVASMTVIAHFAEQVAGDAATVSSVVPVGGDPHVYEPVPSDARAIDEADLVLHNGAGLEPWFAALVSGSGRKAVAMADALADRVVDDPDGVPDPHLWMVPPKAAVYVEVIADAMAEADPAKAEIYRDNAGAYTDRLTALDAELAAELDRIPPDRKMLVTSHDAYTYFAEHYGFEVLGTVVGITTEEEPSARTVRLLVDEVRNAQVPTIFVETTVNPAVIEQIARDADVEVGDPLYGDSLGEEGSGADTYEAMMRANVDALVSGLAPGNGSGGASGS